MFLDQIFSTMILVVTVLSVTDPENEIASGIGPLIIGLSATTMGLCFGSNAG